MIKIPLSETMRWGDIRRMIQGIVISKPKAKVHIDTINDVLIIEGD